MIKKSKIKNQKSKFRIGVFDSGFGGLTILRGFLKQLPQYDYIYLGDNARVPYGSRSPETTYKFTLEAIKYLMRKGCILVIIACNTASALALRRLQKEWLPKNYHRSRILGVIRPTAEAAADFNAKRIGILATKSTVKSKVFIKEIKKINPKIEVFQQSAPLLVPIIEAGEHNWVGTDLILKKYLGNLLRYNIDALILGCTHYPIIKNKIKKILKEGVVELMLHYPPGKKIKVISEDEIIPLKLKDYLARHQEIEKKLSRRGKRIYLTTDLSPRLYFLGSLFLKKKIKPKLIRL